MKDRKTQKNESEGKLVGLSSASLFPTRKREKVTKADSTGHRPPDVEDNSGKAGSTRKTGEHSRYIHVKQE